MPFSPIVRRAVLSIIGVIIVTVFVVGLGSPAPRTLAIGKCYTVGLTKPPYTSVTVCPPVA